MIPKGLGRVVYAGVVGAVGLAACGDRILDNGIPKGSGGQGGQGGGAATSCWPTDPACYGGGTKDTPNKGGECMAVIDNSPIVNGIQHIQLRQNWLRATQPAGNTVEQNRPVYGALAGYTQLPWDTCHNFGSSGYIQLFDFTLNMNATSPMDAASDGSAPSLGEAWIGFAKYVDNTPAGIQDALTNGLCMVDDTWANTYYLPDSQMSSSANYPPGLPKPMGGATTPWHVKPTHAKRLPADFNLATDRLALLASFMPGGANDGFDAVFYFDTSTGTSHGFSPLSFLVIYDSPTTYIAVPVREAETRSKFNDKDHPNCIGAYRGDHLKVADSCGESTDVNDDAFPAWGCVDTGTNTCDRKKGPATTDGYFLITELEQIYSNVLQSTLCVSYPTYPVSVQNGWASTTSKECRNSSQWNPTAANDAGLPNGDWCAETNSAATSTCHDAYKSFSYHVFSAFPVKDPSVPGGTCKAAN